MPKTGYRNPPQHSRWPRGKSGNPSGRPKRTPNFADDLLTELSQYIGITENGKVRRITKQRALIKALTSNSLKGNVRTASLLIGICLRFIDRESDKQQPSELDPKARKIVEDYLERQVSVRLAERERDES